MATINDISNAAQYRGTPYLGGSVGVGITIDSSPLARLATFQYYRDRDLWQQKQKDNLIAAKQIADIAAYDVNSPFKEYTEDLTKDLNKVKDYFRNTKDAVVYNPNNPQPYIMGQEMLGKFSNKRTHATANDALYNSALAKINLIPDINNRKAAKELLDLNTQKLFSNGIEDAYNQQFQIDPELKPEDYTIPEISLTEKFKIQRNPNDTVTFGMKYADIDHARAQADGIYFGLAKKALDQDSREFKSLSAEDKKRAILQDQITSRVKTNLDNIANNLNGLIKTIGVKIEDIPQDVLSKNTTLAGIINDAKSYNEQIDKINAATGEKYNHINLDDGIAPQEIIVLDGFHKNKSTLFQELKPDVDQTGFGLRWAELGLKKEQLQKADNEDLLGANSVINEISDVINSGKPQVVQNYLRTGKEKEILEIADPNLLKEFSTIDKDGKTTKTPDVIQFDKEKNQLNLVYFDSKPSKSGKRLINESITLSPTQWMGQIVRRKYPNKDIGGINNIVDQVYNANGRNLFKLSQKVAGNISNQTQSSIPEYTLDEWLAAPGWTKERISEYEKKGLIKVKR